MVNEINNIRLQYNVDRQVGGIKPMDSVNKTGTSDDTVALSIQGQMINQAETTTSLPISMQELLKVKDAISSGDYKVDFNMLADALLKRNNFTL